MAEVADAIEHVHSHACSGVSRAMARLIAEAASASPMTAAEGMDIAVKSAYSVGLEIGLSVAVQDVAAGRRLRDWVGRVIQRGDQRAHDIRDHQAQHYLEVLDR